MRNVRSQRLSLVTSTATRNPTCVIVYGVDMPSPDDGLLVLAAIDGKALLKLGRTLGQWRGQVQVGTASTPMIGLVL